MNENVGEYPADWPLIAWMVKEAAGFRCVRCKHPAQVVIRKHGKRVLQDRGCDDECTHLPDGKQRVLTVHHLDGDKCNIFWWNLAPLCQACHLSIQAKVVMGQTYLYPHTEWMKPFAAGFYAFTMLNEHLTRAEVMERLDELLLVGQPHLKLKEGRGDGSYSAADTLPGSY